MPAMPTDPPTLDDFPSKVRAIILEEVLAAPSGVSVDEVLSRYQGGRLARIRWRIWYRQRHELTVDGKPPSWPHIAGPWRRDHTTVMEGALRYELEMADPLDGRPTVMHQSALKQRAYTVSRKKHAEKYRQYYPHLGMPHARTPT